MATDGSLSLWGANGPVVWHSETSVLGYWYAGGVYSDFKTEDTGTVVLTCLSGNWNLAGQSAGLLKSLKIDASAGEYSYAGQSVNLLRSLLLGAGSGNWNFAGQSVGLLKSSVLSA